MSNKFSSLEELILEYYGLVKEHMDELPPYAKFKTYLDDENYIDRPSKVKALVEALGDDEDKKLDSILALWACDKKSTVLDPKLNRDNNSQLIHSITPRANTLATRLKLKDLSYDDQKSKILDFADEIKKLVEKYSLTKELPEENLNEKLENFSKLSSAENELLFWYYYEEDTYPIINQRAINSREILTNTFNLDSNNDLKFNQVCMNTEGFNAVKKNNSDEIYISKQLMLDQLFYSIDDMKNMKKVDEQYLKEYNEENEIYEFYKKLWNSIKEAKTNKILQDYYDQFSKGGLHEKWYGELRKWSDILHDLQTWARESTSFTYQTLNERFKELSKNQNEDFLQRYLFKSSNGIAGAGMGIMHINKEEVYKKSNLDSLLSDILTSDDIDEVNDTIKEITGSANLLRHRFLASLFSDKMTTIVNSKDFNTLIFNLKQFGIKLEVDGYIEKNNALMGIYLKYDGIEENDFYKKQIFYWWLHTKLDNNLELKNAIVYYGAPGTGKTFKAKNIAKEFLKTWALKSGRDISQSLIDIVQFHPSFSYEDFIEGIRPSQDAKLKLKDGVFKKFCKTAGDIEIKLWKNDSFREKFKENNDFRTITIQEVLELKDTSIDELLQIDVKSKNLKLQNIIPPAFFIIDEINRADLSRVFGELMYSLEYRGYEGKVKTQYSYLVNNKIDDAIFFYENEENYFFIPQNIYIIGTMNTIDRSVDSFDFALRRRFSWEEIKPDYDVIENTLNKKISKKIAEAFKALNKEIKNNSLLGSDYQIGHSYALNLQKTDLENSKDAKSFLWDNFIHSLLQEYFRGLGEGRTQISKLKEEFDK